MKLICVESVNLVQSALKSQRESIGWNSSSGTYIFTTILNRSGSGTLKKRNAELCAWNQEKALEIEAKYKQNKKVFMCSDMKTEFQMEISKLEGQCKMDNTKLPANCDFYKSFVDCYSTSSRRDIL